MLVSDFDFELPPERIAAHPVYPRDSAKLLQVGDGLADKILRDLPDLLNPGDLMVFNNTRVIPARLFGKRGEAGIEVTLLKPLADGEWTAFARPGKRLKLSDRVSFGKELHAMVTHKADDGQVHLAFSAQGDAFFAQLKKVGSMPLPPYIKRLSPDAQDERDYQTIYAKEEGAVAAPTAGLHFTESLFQALEARGVEKAFVTLHVGAGTFLPVKVEDTKDHVMHSEWGQIDAETVERIRAAKARGNKVVAVGTTSLRVLESAARDGELKPFSEETDIFITPGYQFKVVDRLLTNFHLPKSTLFMLVSAFAGLDKMQAAYAHAIAHDYRFYSYGDACLLTRQG